LICDQRIKSGEVDVPWWRYIKNHIINENELNYDQLKNHFLKLEFNEYSFKRDEKNIWYVGLYSDDVSEHEYFKKYIIEHNTCDDIDNINLKCQCKLDHDNIYDIITNEKLNIDNDTKIKIYLCNFMHL
jgi:hypothetical protein